MPWINSLRDSRLNFISSNVPKSLVLISCIQSLSHVWLSTIPWTAACQASLPITNTQSLLKLMSVELVMPSNHLILCCPLLLLPSFFPSIRIFSSESVLHIRWPKCWSFSFSINLIKNIQDWFPLGLTGWISLKSKGLSRVFPTQLFKNINFSVISYLYSPTLTSISDCWKNHSFD